MNVNDLSLNNSNFITESSSSSSTTNDVNQPSYRQTQIKISNNNENNGSVNKNNSRNNESTNNSPLIFENNENILINFTNDEKCDLNNYEIIDDENNNNNNNDSDTLKIDNTLEPGRDDKCTSPIINNYDNTQTTPQKTVCFHSITGQPPGSDRKITNAIDCLQYMINGTTLIKVKTSLRHYRRFYTLDEDLSNIRWSPSMKKTSKAKLIVNSIREVRRGKNTDVLKNPEITEMYREDCLFSIIFGDDFESLDLIALSSAEANIWVTGLNFLIGLIRSPDSLECREKMREKWLHDVFDEADSEHNGMLDELKTISVFKKLNEHLCIDNLKQKINEFEMNKKNGEQRGCISKHAFISLFTQTATRPDIYFILVRYCGRDYMTIEEFQLFLEGEQSIQGTSLEICANLIDRYEQSYQARQQKQLLIDGFTQFLMSDTCDILGMNAKQITQNMNRPFIDYFISSSYNTYLLEDQVKGPSSCEGYRKALASGCRCVKIDVHDGPDCCPIVYNRNTLTSRILLKDVLNEIKKMAFVNSVYPLIIHLENHCSWNVQKVVAKLFIEIFGDQLFLLSNMNTYTNNTNETKIKNEFFIESKTMETKLSNSSLDDNSQIATYSSNCDNNYCSSIDTKNIWSKLTPQNLMYKIIISGKKSHFNDEVSDEETENHDNSAENDQKKKYLNKICPELCEIITMNRVECHYNKINFDNPNLLHLNESIASKIVQQNIEELTQRNKNYLTQITPDVSRIDSSNLNPLDFWNCGVQLLSMNYQTNGQIMNIYRGWFSQNGSCGYVLKPSYLREKYSTFNLRKKEAIISGIDPMNIRIKIISGQQLPRPCGASLKANSIDPYVIVQCLGTSIDCAEFRTSTVSSDGQNPIFDESFEFNVCLPELTIIRFLVLDDDYINDDFIGQFTVPVSCMESGFKHIKLLNMNDEIIPNATLFVKIALTQRYGSKQRLRRKKSWTHKNMHDAKQMGNKYLDEQMKHIFSIVNEASIMRKDIEKVYIELCDECSLPESANMAQCLRIITLRLATCPTVIGFKIVKSKLGYLSLQVDGELTIRLNRTISTLDRCLGELYKSIDQSEYYVSLLSDLFEKLSNVSYEFEKNTPANLDHKLQTFLNLTSTSTLKQSSMIEKKQSMYDTAPTKQNVCKKTPIEMDNDNSEANNMTPKATSLNSSNSFNHSPKSFATTTNSSPTVFLNHSKHKKSEKIFENLLWNLSIIKNELDSLNALKNESQKHFEQIERIAESLKRIFEREHKIILRSNSYVVREINNVNQLKSNQPSISLNSQSEIDTIQSASTSKLLNNSNNNDVRLRSILKKNTASPITTRKIMMYDNEQKQSENKL